MKLSIIVPVFNEENTIAELLRRVDRVKIKGVAKEVIVINDGSTDDSLLKIKKQKSKIKNLHIINISKNGGKGAAVQTGIGIATGEYIIVQDADLEYDPEDYVKLLEPVIQRKAVVVYGTRLKRLPNFVKDERTVRFLIHYIGNKFLSLITSVLYGQWITDMETCYKLFPRKAIETMELKSRGFEFEPEITAKLLKTGYKIFEVPIKTTPRKYSEGKKLSTFSDGIKALTALIKYRFK